MKDSMEERFDLKPAVVVHGLAHAEAALAAAGLGVAVTLISAEGAAGYAGPSWFRAVIEETRASHPPFPPGTNSGSARREASFSGHVSESARESARHPAATQTRALAPDRT
jgi:hypothetical protein